MNFKCLFFTLTLALGFSAQAQVKSLVCEKPLSASLLPEVLALYEKKCDEDKSQCQFVEVTKQRISQCQKSGLSYSEQWTFAFDVSALQGNGKSFVQAQKKSCASSGVGRIEKFDIESTPEYLIIKTANSLISSNFTIDRKLLIGSYQGKAEWRCLVQDINVEQNKI